MRSFRHRGWSILGAGLLALALPLPAWADGLLSTLLGPAAAVAPGTQVGVSLLAVNPGTAGASFSPPPTLAGTLWRADRSWPVELRTQPSAPAEVAAGAFVTRAYVFQLPEGATGQLILEITQGLPQPVNAVIAVAGVDQGEFGPRPATPDTAPLAVPNTAAGTLQRSFIDHFSALDPIYFIYGPKAPSAKFQFSFKYRLLLFEEGGEHQPESSLQFGYTQRSLWDVNASSSPFYDTSYIPSLFYQFLTPAPGKADEKGGVTWLGFASGYQHESNGQDSLASRSFNTLYLRTAVLFGRPDRWHAIAQLRGFDYVGGLSDNPDLKDYRGYGEWQVIIARGEGPSLSYTGRAGKDADHFTSQFDLYFPVKTKFLDFATYFLIQYFDGYGESLRAYNQHSDTVRAGISLVR